MLNTILSPLFSMMVPANIKTNSIERQRQFMVVVSLILISSSFLITLGIITALQGATLLSVLDFSIAVFFIGLGIILKQTGKIKEISSIILSMLSIYFYYLFFYGGLERSTWVWYYTFPLWAIFLKGKKEGTLLSLFLIGVTTATYFFMSTANHEPYYSFNLMIRFLFSYLCVVFITYVMEDTRVQTYQKLLDSNSELSTIVEELNNTRQELQELSIRDSLTKLFNRRHFDHTLLKTAEKSQPFTIIMLDIDYFKTYNDNYGHPAGDDVLKLVSIQLESLVNRETDMVFRYGGEEFAMIIPKHKSTEIPRLCDAIIATIRNLTIPHQASPFKNITISLGAAIIPESPTQLSTHEILKFADSLLYKAKQSGRNKAIVQEIELTENMQRPL